MKNSTRARSDITSDEVTWGTAQLDHWIQIPAIGKTTSCVFCPWSVCVRTGSFHLPMPAQWTVCPDAHQGHDSKLIQASRKLQMPCQRMASTTGCTTLLAKLDNSSLGL